MSTNSWREIAESIAMKVRESKKTKGNKYVASETTDHNKEGGRKIPAFFYMIAQ